MRYEWSSCVILKFSRLDLWRTIYSCVSSVLLLKRGILLRVGSAAFFCLFPSTWSPSRGVFQNNASVFCDHIIRKIFSSVCAYFCYVHIFPLSCLLWCKNLVHTFRRFYQAIHRQKHCAWLLLSLRHTNARVCSLCFGLAYLCHVRLGFHFDAKILFVPQTTASQFLFLFFLEVSLVLLDFGRNMWLNRKPW